MSELASESASESASKAAEQGVVPPGETQCDVSEDFAVLDDSALLSRRAEMRDELERLPPDSPDHAALTARYDQSTLEVNERARRAWSQAARRG